MLSVNRSAQSHCPSEKTKLTVWQPRLKHKGQVCRGGISPSQGQPRALVIPEASLGFSRGGISKNKTRGLQKPGSPFLKMMQKLSPSVV